MAWLKIPAGGEAILQIKTGVITSSVVHWVDKKTSLCTGPGCQLCQLGNKQDRRFSMEVLQAGNAVTWEFPEAVLKQLQKLVDNPSKLAGTGIRVRRVGNNYVVDPYLPSQVPHGTIPSPVGGWPGTEVQIVAPPMDVGSRKRMNEAMFGAGNQGASAGPIPTTGAGWNALTPQQKDAAFPKATPHQEPDIANVVRIAVKTGLAELVHSSEFVMILAEALKWADITRIEIDTSPEQQYVVDPVTGEKVPVG